LVNRDSVRKCETLLLRRWPISSFFSDDVPTMSELRFAELYGDGVGAGREEEGEDLPDALGGMFGMLKPLICPRELSRESLGDALRGGVEGSGRDRSGFEAFAAYAESMGEVLESNDGSLWFSGSSPLLASKVLLNLEDVDDVDVTVVERDEGKENADASEDTDVVEGCRR
jgi:hypothetical protein